MTIFERRIQMICTDFKGRMAPGQAAMTAEALLAVWDKYAEIDPDCMPMLHALAATGAKMALISNYDHPRHVHSIVQSSGMNSLFSAVIVSGDHGVKKPDPAIFRLALEKVGTLPADTFFVGDSEEDGTGANRACLISVLVDREGKGTDYGQQYTIRALTDVLSLTGIA